MNTMWISSLNWRPESISTLLAKEQDKKEIQEGLIKACDVIDLIIEILRGSKNIKDAKACLTNGVTERYQIQDVRFHRRWRRCYALRSARLQQSWKCVCIS